MTDHCKHARVAGLQCPHCPGGRAIANRVGAPKGNSNRSLYDEKTVRIGASVPESLAEQGKDAAAEQGLTFSQWIARCIRKSL